MVLFRVLSKQKSSEQGVALLLGVFLIGALLTLVGIILASGYRNLVKTELQTASDAAAHAGASILCATKQCWSDARIAAAQVLEQQSAHSSPGHTKSLAFEFDAATAGVHASTWNSGDNSLVVTIERGRYVPDSGGFTSFEEWDKVGSVASEPGLNGFVAANAMRVTITRKDASPVLSGILGSKFDVTASAVAVADEVADTCAAPFAIPVCALIDQEGDYRSDKKDPDKTNFAHDRLFTSVGRYQVKFAVGGKEQDIFPSFPIEPSDKGSEGFTIDIKGSNRPGYFPPGIVTDSGLGMANMNVFIDKRQGFSSNRYQTNIKSSIIDNFGVVGLPVRSGDTISDVKETDIINTIGTSKGCVNGVSLGDKFKILGAGLLTTASNDAIWNRINNTDPDNNPPYYQASIGTKEKLYNPKGVTDGAEPYVQGSAMQFNTYMGVCKTHEVDCDSEGKHCRDELSSWCNKVGEPKGPSDIDVSKAPNGYPLYAVDVDDSYKADGDQEDNHGLCNSTRLKYAWDHAALNKFGTSIQTDRTKVVQDEVLKLLHGDTHDVDLMTPFDYKINSGHDPDELDAYTKTGVPDSYELGDRPPVDFFVSLINTPVWHIDIPVIAERGTSGKACMNTDGKQPDVAPSNSWEIIGFVKVNFYDVDIGQNPPNPPAGAQLSAHPYTFLGNRCNAVRGRIEAGNDFVATTNPNSPRKTLLVR